MDYLQEFIISFVFLKIVYYGLLQYMGYGISIHISIPNLPVFRSGPSIQDKQSNLTLQPLGSLDLVFACFSAVSVATYYKTEWFSIPPILGLLFICFIQFRKTRKREAARLEALAGTPDEVEVDDYLAYLYQCLPLRTASKAFGYVSDLELPKPVLKQALNLYCWAFSVNLEEANVDQLDAYKSISEFFQRELKPEVRAIDTQKPAVVPCDGRVLHYGRCENGMVEQVKGVRYSIERFLGYRPQLTDPANNDLFYCVLYLAPGDYHLFHSPCSWIVDKVIHFPGTLMSVNPAVCKIVRGVFTLNERVLLSGTWKHGFFSYTAVGATGVGSIKINFLNDKIQTNRGFLSFEKDTEIDISPNEHLQRGAMLGGFNFGSTVVLMFEAPKTFQFSFKAGEKVRLGDPLGDFPAPAESSTLEGKVEEFYEATENLLQDLATTKDTLIHLADKQLADCQKLAGDVIEDIDEVIEDVLDNAADVGLDHRLIAADKQTEKHKLEPAA